jgi:protein O-mannosyl-transferase
LNSPEHRQPTDPSGNAEPRSAGGFWKQDWFFALLLAVATFLAYQPAWKGEAVYDDEDHLTPRELSSVSGLARIWTELGAVSQYYPIVHSAFWVQYQFWGYSMPGYHAVNILLHVLCAWLLFRILKRLDVPGAWLAAAIFALHPVAVESVAWISELKNTLSTFFYLAAGLAYLSFDGTRRKGFYAVALMLFLLGLLSKTVIATLPAALLVVFWWKRGTLSWKRDVSPLIPFFMLGIAAGLLTAWVERKFIGAEGESFELTLIQRGLIAGRVIWFYLGKLFWPVDLIFIYPRWQVSAAAWWQFLFPITALLLVGGLWWLRKRTRGPLAALLVFGGTLVPVLGFLNVYPFRYSFVADHYQYLASLAVITAAAAGITLLLQRWQLRGKPAGNALCLVLLAVLAGLSWRQSRMYADVETLWRTTIARNPDCFVAYSNLGNLLLQKGEREEAIVYCLKAIQLQPDVAEAYNNLGNAFLQEGRNDEAMRYYQEALKLRPDLAVVWLNVGNLLRQSGKTDEAIGHFKKAVELRPEFVSARTSLAKVLLEKGRADEAVDHAQKALNVLPDDADALGVLGQALLQKGRASDAVTQFQKLLQLQPGNVRAMNDLGTALNEAGRPDEALEQFQKAVALRSDFVVARHNLGMALLKRGRKEEAIAQLQKIVELQPDSANARNNLGWMLRGNGNLEQAIAQLRKAVELRPNYSEAWYNLGKALSDAGQGREAVAAYRKTLAIQPSDLSAQFALSALLATSPDESQRNGVEAVQLAERANQVHLQKSGERQPTSLRILAAAYAESGRYPEAISTAEQALQLAESRKIAGLAEGLRSDLKLYRQNTPLRDVNLAVPAP